MQRRADTPILLRMVLTISLCLMVPFIIGFSISCQPQTPRSEPGPELSEEPTQEEPSATPSTIEVTIEGFAFKPAEITIAVGSTIVWRNKDSVTHTVTAQNRLFDSGSLLGGDTFSYTFNEKGIYEYYCIYHPYMNGKVIVE